MQNKINPFTPSFGDLPPMLIGRERIIEDINIGLSTETNDPFRSVLFTGTRGSGKTVMLEKIAKMADNKGFITINITAGNNMITDIIDQLNKKTAHLFEKRSRKIKSVSIRGFGLSFDRTKEEKMGFRHLKKG
jgi:Cdc6-like AAA superfamily ATPase